MARYCKRFTAEGAGIREKVRMIDGETTQKRGEGGEDVRIFLNKWAGCCMTGNKEQEHVTQTGAMVTAIH